MDIGIDKNNSCMGMCMEINFVKKSVSYDSNFLFTRNENEI
jgi:hypothetical protein